ncbi:MAG: hypothetical protein RLZ39_334 [Bacteroidota bacterium]
MKNLVLGIVAMLLFQFTAKAQQLPLLPYPNFCAIGPDSFVLEPSTVIRYASLTNETRITIPLCVSYLKQSTGFNFSINNKEVPKNSIELLIGNLADSNKEAYELRINKNAIQIKANTSAGLLYGTQTLLQLLPLATTHQAIKIPTVFIKDAPRFAWRGMHLDVSRHFFNTQFIKEYIDFLAAFKMNVFHWHLCDDQGWRIEIKKYPKLTEIGAWRVDRDKEWRDAQPIQAGEKASYGGYYTQDEIKEIVAYAAARNITVVPEIEMPGHSIAALAAYPNLSCTQVPQAVIPGGIYPKGIQSNYCAGNDSVLVFLKEVLNEVIQLFPSKLIHIGGDEVDKTDWKHCAKCQARIQQEHLKNEEELQSWFISNIEQYVISKGRSIIGWDEILEGGLAPNASVMSWRGEQGGIDAAKMKHTVVMTPGTHCYFDHYQADPQSEPIAIGGFTTLKKVYSYEPIPAALPSAYHKYVLGAQANLWTEYIPTVEQAEYMILPRMQALSEVLWTQKQVTDWSSFITRLQPYLRKFEQQGWRYCEGNFKVAMQPRVINNTMKVSLEAESKDDQIVYSLDGTEPSLFSPIYKDSLVLSSTCVVKAQLVHKQVLKGRPSTMHFTMHAAFGVVPSFEKPFNTYYPANGAATLTDGILGNTDHHANWLGWSKSDMVATLSFSKDTLVHEVELGCLQNYASWIFFPEWIKVFAINKDGSQKELAMHTMERKATKGAVINRVKLSFPEQKLKTIKIVAGPLPACPKEHPGYGDTGWLFFDEIVVK